MLKLSLHWFTGRSSFPRCVTVALRLGWKVEVYAWKNSMATCYQAFASLSEGYMTIHYLDDWRADVRVFEAAHPTHPLPPIVLIPGAFLCVHFCRYPSAQTACELERARERRS